ncbi:MAG: 3,4-dihydroxy-2-butanone-4-phosphate synthase [Sedimentisphaerales bacterium]|nr:3,4-dihydroxy-2-butanone-4-phosphate synthase [Sedimentisphaerales bacterium]MBN2843118.1 3,4-dihydroxy-2-butanone-4-phosphate synthase [Sedimentisphaerales bacterium]
MNKMELSNIPEILDELRAGRMIVLVDDEDRENEGDLVCASEKCTPEIVNFMATHGRGLICVSLESQRCQELNLHPQCSNNTAALGTAFTVSVDAAHGITTGISAADRNLTIHELLRPDAKPSDLARPGHIFPLTSRSGGVLMRVGQTEGSLDLARLAGLYPSGVICEIMNDDGTMARVPQLKEYCLKHNLKMTSVAKLVEYRMLTEKSLIRRIEEVEMPTDCGIFRLIGYETLVDNHVHLALCKGDVGIIGPDGKVIEQKEVVPVRVHSECLTGDVFHSMRCDCGSQLHEAMRMIDKHGKGAVIYLRQEGRGIGLAAKLKAYKLQQNGMDTVQANIALGFDAEKRDFGLGAHICRDLGISRIANITNNPLKTDRLRVFGISVEEQIPLEFPPNKYNYNYLKTKKEIMGHCLRHL